MNVIVQWFQNDSLIWDDRDNINDIATAGVSDVWPIMLPRTQTRPQLTKIKNYNFTVFN